MQELKVSFDDANLLLNIIVKGLGKGIHYTVYKHCKTAITYNKKRKLRLYKIYRMGKRNGGL